MKRLTYENAVFYNAEVDEIYIFENKYFDIVYLISFGTIWHYIGEL